DVGTQDVEIASNRAIERKLDSLVFRKSGIVEFQVKSTGCGSRSQTRLVFAALFDEIDSRHPSWGPFVLPRNVPVRRIRISKIRKDLDICGGSYRSQVPFDIDGCRQTALHARHFDILKCDVVVEQTKPARYFAAIISKRQK